MVLRGGDSRAQQSGESLCFLWSPKSGFTISAWWSVHVLMHRESIQYESLCAVLKIVVLITAGDARGSNPTANLAVSGKRVFFFLNIWMPHVKITNKIKERYFNHCNWKVAKSLEHSIYIQLKYLQLKDEQMLKSVSDKEQVFNHSSNNPNVYN